MGDAESKIGFEDGQLRLEELDTLPDEKQQRITELRAWLVDLENKTMGETIRKAAQYGSSDLKVMGNAMLLLLPPGQRDQRLGLEMAIGFYCLGKVARLFGAFEDGRMPTADDWYDLRVYATMGLKVFETGEWL